MDEQDKAAYEAMQAEKRELGLPTEAVEEAKPTEEAPKQDEVTPESKPKEEEAIPPKKEEEKVDESKPESPRVFKDYKKTLREEMQADFDKKLEAARAEFVKAKPDEKKTDILEDDLESLAKELNFDKDKIKKIIDVARKGIELSPEDKELLQVVKENKEYLKNKKDEDFMREQETIFNNEWSDFQKTLRTQYPNATEDQIAAAREQMDEIAHTEKYGQLELGEIFAVQKAAFEKTLFSPKQTTFEAGRPVQSRTESDEDFTITPEKLSSMTPSQFEAFEKRREAAMDDGTRDKVTITTRDDRGNVIEREE